MKILTANRLTDGEAVWFAEDHSWSETIVGAEVARDKAAEERLEAIGKAAFCENRVVDVDLIDVDERVAQRARHHVDEVPDARHLGPGHGGEAPADPAPPRAPGPGRRKMASMRPRTTQAPMRRMTPTSASGGARPA